MQEAFSDKILPIPGSADDGYRFRVAKYFAEPAGVRVIEISDAGEEEELEIVTGVLSSATEDDRVHVW